MFRLIIVAAVIVLIVLYLKRDRLKAVARNLQAVFQNPVVRTRVLRSFFFTLGRLIRIGVIRRFFKL